MGTVALRPTHQSPIRARCDAYPTGINRKVVRFDQSSPARPSRLTLRWLTRQSAEKLSHREQADNLGEHLAPYLTIDCRHTQLSGVHNGYLWIGKNVVSDARKAQLRH